jgi:hypothetical protein
MTTTTVTKAKPLYLSAIDFPLQEMMCEEYDLELGHGGHGGHCCSISHLYGFDQVIDYDGDLHYDISDCDFERLIASETARIIKNIYRYARESRGTHDWDTETPKYWMPENEVFLHSVQVTVTSGQDDHLRGPLEAVGYKQVDEIVNGNTDNTVYVYMYNNGLVVSNYVSEF